MTGVAEVRNRSPYDGRRRGRGGGRIYRSEKRRSRREGEDGMYGEELARGGETREARRQKEKKIFFIRRNRYVMSRVSRKKKF